MTGRLTIRRMFRPGRSALRALNGELDAALRTAHYDTMHRELPGLVGELEVHAATADGPARDEALRQLILACKLDS